MYSWARIATRTEVAYAHAIKQPQSGDLSDRAGRLLSCGPVVGVFALLIAAVDALWFRLVCWLDPAQGIESAICLQPSQ